MNKASKEAKNFKRKRGKRRRGGGGSQRDASLLPWQLGVRSFEKNLFVYWRESCAKELNKTYCNLLSAQKLVVTSLQINMVVYVTLTTSTTTLTI
jgi:hypothetical protein